MVYPLTFVEGSQYFQPNFSVRMDRQADGHTWWS